LKFSVEKKGLLLGEQGAFFNTAFFLEQGLVETTPFLGVGWGVPSGQGGIDAISGAASPAFPREGYTWKEGMPTTYSIGKTTLVVSTSSNKYLNINNRELYWQFADYVHSKGSSFKFHPINTLLDGTSMMILGMLCTPNPLPDWEVKEKHDRMLELRKVDWYMKSGIIKP
jgi:hypothetical protein